MEEAAGSELGFGLVSADLPSGGGKRPGLLTSGPSDGSQQGWMGDSSVPAGREGRKNKGKLEVGELGPVTVGFRKYSKLGADAARYRH